MIVLTLAGCGSSHTVTVTASAPSTSAPSTTAAPATTSANDFRSTANQLYTQLSAEQAPIISRISAETNNPSAAAADIDKATALEQTYLVKFEALQPPSNLAPALAAYVRADTSYIAALHRLAAAIRNAASNPAAVTAAATAVTTTQTAVTSAVSAINAVN